MAQTKIELTAAKAYIHTLPTQQEVQKLKVTQRFYISYFFKSAIIPQTMCLEFFE